jgi:2-polyprenyl-6-methoxyphenol hydroxylase-like FAD-dependent oxidoreductase
MARRPRSGARAIERVVSTHPYGFLHIFPQGEHERLLIGRLEGLGVRVERAIEVLSYTDEATKYAPDRWRGTDDGIAGCDGARSKVREGMTTNFELRTGHWANRHLGGAGGVKIGELPAMLAGAHPCLSRIG